MCPSSLSSRVEGIEPRRFSRRGDPDLPKQPLKPGLTPQWIEAGIDSEEGQEPEIPPLKGLLQQVEGSVPVFSQGDEIERKLHGPRTVLGGGLPPREVPRPEIPEALQSPGSRKGIRA